MAQNISAAVYGAVLNGSFEGRPSNDSSQKLEECQALYQNETVLLQQLYPGEFCKVSYDQIFCWPPTPHNTTAQLSCFSEFFGIRYDDTQNVTRKCFANGTWSKSSYDACAELDIYPTSVETQSNIYLIGYIISSITLAVAIFIFSYFKELRCLRNKIHMNLLWSYLLTYCMWIAILIGLNFREHMAVTCVFVVTLLHYFHITTFFWMFVEGLYLYILVVQTLIRDSYKLRVYVAIGWGTPLFFIIVWVIFKSILEQHDQSDACNWFNASHIDYIFQVPTIIVLVVNIIFLVSIMVVLVTKLRSANTLEIQQYRKAVKALAVLIPLLGVTYAITIYAPWLSIWDMLRSALLSVQGFMVALFYCFLNTEVQNTLKHHFENWKTKKSLGPSRLRSSSRSKDWSPRSRTESLRLYSQPTNMYNKRESCTSDATTTTLVTVNGGTQGRSPYLQPPKLCYGGSV
ncbi:diuretic hormone receptor isoform X2 [Dendroctonus ponderosae]|uniref:diuretic hormone receptor isoform X2 n=1 Tax=Dendroctonus ponderosae TaxID=77166 RepID=UPI002034DEDD|nr:diuretic hormone receptor isoform X2 [Dendroctonus ponderosae]XP_048524327.1 diuretic hormone receptor isoform X2 [Dendroctonus ponderosae]XP_048524328.1 diuretic hormone receptor isoform X2 [Dendroctonus ponderosae]